MNHLVMYSGGLASWDAARLAIQNYGAENVILLHTDTLGEDPDCYRFMIEGAAALYGVELPAALLNRARSIPLFEDGYEWRKEFLPQLAAMVHACLPQFFWTNTGETIWDAFKRNRALGSTRFQICSNDLKIKPSEKFLKRFKPEEITLHFGLDWSETARLNKVKARREPYFVSSDYHDSLRSHSDAREALSEYGLLPPSMYALGFTHANCSGFCVKAGQKHFAKLLEVRPELYAFSEMKEEEIRSYLGKDVSILRDRRGGETTPLPMAKFRQRGKEETDENDLGACGCYI